MGKTIIQTIGPLYGESVNGTVFGRPNGSIYTPSQNTIALSMLDFIKNIRSITGAYALCASNGTVYFNNPAYQAHIVAESQDIANHIVLQVSKSSDFSTIEGTISFNAGDFNLKTVYASAGDSLTAIVNGDTYYVRAVLMASSNEPVATSSAVTLTGVSP